MANKVRAVPEGMHTITPHLVVSDGPRFIDWVKKAFGAEESMRMMHPSASGIWHASLRIGDSTFFITDESVSPNMKSARSMGGAPFTIQLNVENADHAFKQATQAGGVATMPLMDMFWGDRYGQVKDPFGNIWGISTHVKDVTPQEMERGAKEAAAQQARR